MRPVLAWLLAVAPALLAVALRLRDPLSSRVIGAEDPFMHVVYATTYLDLGFFPRYHVFGQSVYPHGLHALTGAVTAVTGIPPLDVARWLPPLLGLPAAGLALAAFAAGRAARGAAAAGVSAALLLATAPEIVLRQEILFPTALVLVLVPLVVAASAMAARGLPRAAWLAAVALPALALAHPWSVPFALVAAAGALATGVLGPAHGVPRARVAVAGVALAVGSVAFLAWLFPFGGYWNFSMDRMERVADRLVAKVAGAGSVGVPELAVGALALGLAGTLLALAARRLGTRRALAAAGSVVLAVAVAAAAWLAATLPPLPLVDHVESAGPALLALGAAGAVLYPLRPRDGAAAAGLALAAASFPLTVFDPFNSWFLPHRMLTFLALALVLLGGGAVGHAAAALARLRAVPRRGRVAAASVAALALVVATVPAGAAAPTWYRYFEADEYEGLEEVAARLDEDPWARAVVGSWQAHLVLSALAGDDWRRVHFKPQFFENPHARESYVAEHWWHETVIVLDRFATHKASRADADLGFLTEAPYEPAWSDGPHQAVYVVPPRWER